MFSTGSLRVESEGRVKRAQGKCDTEGWAEWQSHCGFEDGGGPRATDNEQPQNLPGEGEGSDSRLQPEPYFDLAPLKTGSALLN